MIAIITLLIVLVVSIFITRVATVALTHTGLSRQSARFQARSAFTGVGFTTSESEKVVSHPARRRILMLLMLLGNAGVVTAVSTLIIGFVSAREAEGTSLTLRVVLLVGGLVLLWGLASSKLVDRHLSNVISRMLKRYTRIDVQDYASLLHLAGEYRVTEMLVRPEDWIAERRLRELRLREEGVMLLGITREDGTFLGAPHGGSVIHAGDTVVLYGRGSMLASLDERRRDWSGEHEHEKAVAAQEEIEHEEEAEDSAATRRRMDAAGGAAHGDSE